MLSLGVKSQAEEPLVGEMEAGPFASKQGGPQSGHSLLSPWYFPEL